MSDTAKQKTTYAIVGSDGQLEVYNDPFVLTSEQIHEAEVLENQIIEVKQSIDKDFILLGILLDEFDRTKGYLAKGYESFRLWISAGEIDFSYRLAHDLLRIVREVLPILGPQERIPSISQLRELLPLLSDPEGKEKLLHAFTKATEEELTVRDTREHVRELRGTAIPIDQPRPALFYACVDRGETFHRVRVMCGTGVDYYEVGQLNVKPEHYARLEAIFGHFVEIRE